MTRDSLPPITLPGTWGSLRKGTPAMGPVPEIATVVEASVSDWVVLSFHWEMPPYKRHEKWRFRRFTIGRGYYWDSIPTFGRPWEHCPALADLDPSDRTLLADGSRRVVALALQAVCLQMGGGR